MKAKFEKKQEMCSRHFRAIRDTMDIIGGKWKIPIIGSLSFGKKRFMELIEDVNGIAAKMLSKELKDLEENELVKRSVYDTKPVTVEYELTPYGKTLEKVIAEIAGWGARHRQKIMAKK
jgi:DNA-binding HxlR family transcriptional regulator